jgi:hypothetical protein
VGKAVPAVGGALIGLVLGALVGIQVERTWPIAAPVGPEPGPAVPPPAPASTPPAPTPAPGPTPTPAPTPGETPPAPTPDGAKPPPSDHPDHVTGARIIRGRVVAEDAIPVPGAWVTAAVDYRPAADAICDKDGAFVLVVPGDLPITVRARARRASESQTLEIAAEPGTPVTVVLTVRDRGTLRGRVVGSSGDPVVGAAITVTWHEPADAANPPVDDDGNPDLMPERRTESDAEGAFVVPGCWPGSAGGWFLVRAAHRRHYEQSAQIAVPDPWRLHEPFGVQLTLLDAAGGVAKARLCFQDGRPVPSAYVMGMIRDGREIKEWARFDVADGAFELKFGRAGATVVLVPMVNGVAGNPHTLDSQVLQDTAGKPDAAPVAVTYVPAPPLLKGKLLPPPGGGLHETRFALEITSGQIAAPVSTPSVKLDPVSGEFEVMRQFFGVEGGAAYGTVAIRAPGCKVKTLDFNAFDGETEDLGAIQLEGE